MTAGPILPVCPGIVLRTVAPAHRIADGCNGRDEVQSGEQPCRLELVTARQSAADGWGESAEVHRGERRGMPDPRPHAIQQRWRQATSAT